MKHHHLTLNMTHKRDFIQIFKKSGAKSQNNVPKQKTITVLCTI